jgi:membrane peptidoglycan carboxypeptidase
VNTILNSDGKVFKKYPANCEQVIQQSTADTINDILRGVMAPGGFGQLLTLEQPSAGKTGTIQNNAAVWFDGYTPNLATSAMIAGANSKGQPVTLNGKSVGGRYIDVAHGSTVAGPMWALAMRAVQGYLPNVSFVPRSTPTGTPITVTVPDVKGLSMEQASRKLADLGFHWSEGPAQDSNARRGRAAGTTPDAGSSLPRGSNVTIHPAR